MDGTRSRIGTGNTESMYLREGGMSVYVCPLQWRACLSFFLKKKRSTLSSVFLLVDCNSELLAHLVPACLPELLALSCQEERQPIVCDMIPFSITILLEALSSTMEKTTCLLQRNKYKECTKEWKAGYDVWRRDRKTIRIQIDRSTTGNNSIQERALTIKLTFITNKPS